jgi:glycosyltransferase involved in cell wall biosynthesis
VGRSALFVTTVPITLEAFLLPFARHFRAQGWRVDALANGATSVEALEGEFDRRFDVAWTRNPLSPSNLLGTAARIRAIVAEGAYDIVHVHTPIAAFVTRFALRNLRGTMRPVVVYTAHGFHFYHGQPALPHALYRTLERIAARWTDYLVTINAEDYKAARSLGGIDPARVRAIPGIGVDVARYGVAAVSADEVAAVRTGLAIPEDAFLLTVIAEFAPVKRHRLLLEAFSAVHAPNAVLLLVGDGPLEAQARELAAVLGIGDRVRFAGYRRDIPAVLAASDALALVSEREGLPRSVLEAMAAGRPIIGTPTRGITDAVGDDAGWIVPATAAALASAIEAAATNPAERSRRGAAARARAVREFSLDAVIADYEELYREAIASRV